MKYKAQIAAVVVLLVVLGGLGASWQFYFAELFEGYRQDDMLRDTLEQTFTQLEQNFRGYKPELLIDEWQGQMQPWRNAREERANFFTWGDWFETDVVPEEGRMLKFWYAEASNQMLYDMYAEVYQKMGGYGRFPQDIRPIFDVAREEDWVGRDVSQAEVRQNLARLSWGISLTDLLLDADVTAVNNIVVWPRRVPDLFNGLLVFQTVGLDVAIRARDLVRFFENLRAAERYFGVEALKISYPYIGYPAEPELNLRFLLTQANYRRPDDDFSETDAAATPGAQRMQDPEERPRVQRGLDVQPNMLQRFWTWFKRTVLYMN